MNLSSFENRIQVLERESEFHDTWADSVDPSSIDVYSLFESITALENKFILSHMGEIHGKKILDIGCGLGESSVYFALKGADVTAVDLSPQMIEFAGTLADRHSVKIKFVVSSAEELRLEKERFDFVYCANLIHHIPLSTRSLFIRHVHDLLKKDGWFYSWDPLKYNPVINLYRKMASEVRSSDEMPLDFKILDEFRKSFKKAGHAEFWLSTLVIFLKYYLWDRYDPNRVRYWKEIYKEDSKDIGWWFNLCLKIDKYCLKIPFVNRLCWNVLFYAQK